MTRPDPLDDVPFRLLTNEQAAMLLRQIDDLTARLAEGGIPEGEQP